MLFDKKIEPCCSYCKFGSCISEDEAACTKRGIVSAAGSCRKFRYDPLKRTPAMPGSINASHLSEKDFSLD